MALPRPLPRRRRRAPLDPSLEYAILSIDGGATVGDTGVSDMRLTYIGSGKPTVDVEMCEGARIDRRIEAPPLMMQLRP